MDGDCLRDRHLSILMGVEVCAVPDPCRGGGVLLAARPGAAEPRPGRSDRPAAQGARRPGAPAPALAGGLPPGRRGVRVRPQRRLRPVAADDQPPPQGAARRRAARPHQARSVGLLPDPERGARRPRLTRSGEWPGESRPDPPRRGGGARHGLPRRGGDRLGHRGLAALAGRRRAAAAREQSRDRRRPGGADPRLAARVGVVQPDRDARRAGLGTRHHPRGRWP